MSASAETWEARPLGPELPISQPEPAPERHPIATRFRSTPLEKEAPLHLAGEGHARAIIIVPDRPEVASLRGAARLLASTLSSITGIERFPVVGESAIRVTDKGIEAEGKTWPHALFLGATEAAARAGVSAGDLKAGGFVRTVRDRHLYIVGHDLSTSGIDAKGTFHGVADLLERHLGVRWLWAGPLGSVIPTQTEIRLPALDERDEPALPQRVIRNMGLNDRAEVGLKLARGEPARYREVISLNGRWLELQRSGSSMELNYKHAYSHWYEAYGKEHPQWFALQPNGSRVQHSSRPRLCKSNPEVIARVARQVLDQYEANPSLDSASISPNDGSGVDAFCMCEACRKLDPVNARPVRLLFFDGKQRFVQNYPSLSDRVATFYSRVAEEVVKVRPGARLGAYAYSAYRDVPLGATLHPAVLIGFVGLDYTDEAVRRKDLERWDGWSRKASTLFLRPNALGGGYGLPFFYPNRLAEDVRHCYRTGMVAADFDSLGGNWATQGINYYILARLLWDPSTEVDATIEDYCRAGFGPAAAPMRSYFAAIEELSTHIAAKGRSAIEAELREGEDDTRVQDRRLTERNTFLQAYFNAFSPEKMKELRGMLEKATALAGNDTTIKERIGFFAIGLDYSDHYRAIVETNSSREAREAMLEWHRRNFENTPLAFNSIPRLWRTQALFRGMD